MTALFTRRPPRTAVTSQQNCAAVSRVGAWGCFIVAVSWGSVSFGQSLTPIGGLERSRVNASIFEPRRTISTGPELQQGLEDGATPEDASLPLQGAASQESTAFSPAADFASGLGTALTPQSLQVQLGLRLGAEYNSNVTVAGGSSRRARTSLDTGESESETGAGEDFILSASVSVSVQTQFAGVSSVGLSLELGYEQYLLNPDFSGPVMNTSTPGGLAFRFATGDVQWTVFDQFSFSNNAADEPELSGVADFSRFSNTAGLEAAWSPSEFLLLQAQYAHLNTSTSSGSGTGSSGDQARDQVSDSFQLSAIHPLNAMLRTGITGSAIFTEQSGSSGGEYTTLGIGPVFSGQITHATDVLISAGIQTMSGGEMDEEEDGWTESGGGGESFYGTFQVNNRLTHFYTHSLSLGRDSRVGLISNTVTTDFIRYSNSLRIGQQAMLSGNIFAERSEQEGGQFSDRFTRHGGGVSLSVPIRPTVSASLGWQFVQKNSDQEERSYSQHRVFASVAWLF